MNLLTIDPKFEENIWCQTTPKTPGHPFLKETTRDGDEIRDHLGGESDIAMLISPFGQVWQGEGFLIPTHVNHDFWG